jgi:hypothetical protein
MLCLATPGAIGPPDALELQGGEGFAGLHLTADLYACQCAPQLMTDPEAIAHLCRTRTEAAGLTRVDDRWVQFPEWQASPVA